MDEIEFLPVLAATLPGDLRQCGQCAALVLKGNEGWHRDWHNDNDGKGRGHASDC